MKKLFILLFLVQSVLSLAQIKTSFELESGFYSDKTLSISDNNYFLKQSRNNMFYVDSKVDFCYKNLHFSQRMVNDFKYSEEVNFGFSALSIDYYTSLYFKKNRVVIGYEHNCLHPILNSHRLPLVTVRGSYDKVFIKINFSNQ